MDEEELLTLIRHKLIRSPTIDLRRYAILLIGSRFESLGLGDFDSWYRDRRDLIYESLEYPDTIKYQLRTEEILEIIFDHFRTSDDFLDRIKVLEIINQRFHITSFSELGLGSFAEFILQHHLILGKIDWSIHPIQIWRDWIDKIIR